MTVDVDNLASAARISTDAVERVAEAIWRTNHPASRKFDEWPKDVIGGSEDLFRQYARSALAAILDDRDRLIAENAKLREQVATTECAIAPLTKEPQT